MIVLKRLSAYLLRFGIVLLIMVALLVSILRFVQPLANDFRGDLAQVLSQRLGYQVSIGTLRLSSAGLAPRLTLERVRLTRPEDGSTALSLRAMELDLDPSATLRTRAPQFDAFTLIGARLVVERCEDGRLRILGLGGLRSDDPRALALFLGQGRLNLAESEILLVDRALGGKLVRLTDLRLRLLNAGSSHSMDLTARLVPPDPIATAAIADDASPESAPSRSNRIRLAAVLEGPPDDPRSWSGRVYAKLDVGNLKLLMHTRGLGLDRLDTQSLSLEMWQQLERGRLVEGLARFDLVGLDTVLPATLGESLDAASTGAPIHVERLRALARLRSQSLGWQLQLGHVELRANGVDLSGLMLDLRLTPNWRLAGLGLTVAELKLDELARALSSSPWPLPVAVREALDRAPHGRVHDLALGLASGGRDTERGWRWRLSAALSGLGLGQKGSVPGFEGLDARLTADQDGGALQLHSQDMRLDLNPLFSLPIHASQLNGQVDWGRVSDGGWRLRAHQVVLANADLSGHGHLTLDLPPGGASPFLDLRARFQDADAAATRRYLPVGVMSPALVGWLEEAIVSGRVQGDAVFRGALSDYPFRERQGRFELLLRFEDLLLDYQNGWPPIESAEGSLRFLNQSLTIHVDRGRIYDSAFSDGRAELPEMWGVKSMRIHGEAQGPFSDGQRVLKESPLADGLGSLAQALEVTGESRLALDIDLPFQRHHKIGVEGRLTWPGAATLGVAKTPLVLSELTGELNFTERSVDARSIGAKLWGRPMKLSIRTEGVGHPDTSITRIEARAQTPVETLSEQLPSALWRSTDGQLDWTLAVMLHNRDVGQRELPLDFELSSRLRGLSLDFPAPLGKSAGATRDLRLGGVLKPGQSLSIDGYLGNLGVNLRLHLGSEGTRLDGGRFRLGDRSAPEPDPGQLWLDGSLKELSLSPWIDWLESKPNAPGDAGAGLTAGLDLDIGRLSLGALRLTDARVQADARRAGGWQVAIRSSELTGRIYGVAPGEVQPLGINLERLDLEALLTNLAKPATGKGRGNGLEQLPSLDLRAAELSWGRASLGSLDLRLRRDASGIRIPRIELAGPGLMTLKGDGEWTQGARRGRSQIHLRLTAPDLGRLLSELSHKTLLEAKDATALISLGWPGLLTDFTLPRAAGSLDLNVGQGRFLEVEPGVGRVLGFLNFGALGRRLALDFTDLYGQGFAFEGVSGAVVIERGMARFDDFVIDGTAGKVLVDGSTDLETERLDQVVTVEPKLGSSVALASAVAGGPVVGAAVYLVDRVAGNPIDRLASYQYKISGSWDDPELTRMGWEPLSRSLKPSEAPGASTSPKPPKNLFLDIP